MKRVFFSSLLLAGAIGAFPLAASACDTVADTSDTCAVLNAPEGSLSSDGNTAPIYDFSNAFQFSTEKTPSAGNLSSDEEESTDDGSYEAYLLDTEDYTGEENTASSSQGGLSSDTEENSGSWIVDTKEPLSESSLSSDSGNLSSDEETLPTVYDISNELQLTEEVSSGALSSDEPQQEPQQEESERAEASLSDEEVALISDGDEEEALPVSGGGSLSSDEGNTPEEYDLSNALQSFEESSSGALSSDEIPAVVYDFSNAFQFSTEKTPSAGNLSSDEEESTDDGSYEAYLLDTEDYTGEENTASSSQGGLSSDTEENSGSWIMN